MLKVCPQCGNEFKTYYRKSIYCGKACHSASMVTAKTYTCAGCGIAFQRPNHIMKTDAEKRYCSAACFRESRRANRLVATCAVCGVTFHPAGRHINHCSTACRNAGLVTASMERCECCGKEYRAFASEVARGRRFCSSICSENYRVGNRHPNYRGGRWLKHGTRWKQVRQAVLERDKVCRWCGTDRNPSGRALSVHHINARRAYLIVDVANDMDNLVTLCAPCHGKVEMAITHGHLDRIPSWLRPRV